MKKIILVALILTLLFSGCASGPSKEASASGSGGNSSLTSNSGEPTYYPTYDSNYKTARNDVFDFWFDIPSDWKAHDNTKDGSGYSVLPDSGNVELKVYGVNKDGNDDAFYKKLSGGNGSITDFVFTDGWAGKRVQDGSKIYFVRTDGDTYICFSIDYSKDEQWYNDNKDKLDHVAKSLRIHQGSLGNIGSGTNKITKDDLQLGNLKLNMTYDDVVKEMKSDPVNVEKNTDDGIASQTLTFSDNTQILLVDGVVNSINVVDPGYQTPRGLKVGDSSERIKELYGEPDEKSDSTQWGYDIDGYELFTIVLKDDKVVEIEVDLVM